MAKRIQAIAAYGPRVKLGETAGTKELAELLAQRTGIKSSEVVMVLTELSEGIQFFARSGRAVKLDGIGTFSPTVDLGGDHDIGYRADRVLATALDGGRFRGQISNRERVGLSGDDLVTLWNTEHPDDPVA